MKIEWTTIESGKNLTKSRVDTILENKSRLSVFFAENKKHLFWAWISTMAMAFVVTAWQMSWTEFSANLVFPTLPQEISDSNVSEPISEAVNSEFNNSDNDIILWDLDLSFDDEKDLVETNEVEDWLDALDVESDNTEDLINDLFWTEEINLTEDLNNDVSAGDLDNSLDLDLFEAVEDESTSEKDILSLFLENDEITTESKINKTKEVLKKAAKDVIFDENLHGAAEKDVENEIVWKAVFKQNFHTVDLNLVSEKAEMKDSEDMHWSRESFLEWSSWDMWFWTDVSLGTATYDYSNNNSDIISNTASDSVWKINNINNVNNAKKLNQTWPWDMLFWLWFLSMILAFFFRRKNKYT
jgi:hypothetical protein